MRRELVANLCASDGAPSPDALARLAAATARERDETAERRRITRSMQQQIGPRTSLHSAAVTVAEQEGCSVGTVKNIWARVAEVPPADWSAALLKGRRGPAPDEDAPEAAAFFAAVYREMERGAATRTLQHAHCAVVRQLGEVLSYRQTRRR